MKKKTIIANLKIIEARDNGGRIRINTGALDRDRDRVMPMGAQFENYLKNPVVLWGHNYYDPWSVIGRTNQIEQTDEYIDVDFDLREPASESDPVRIIRLLWNDKLVKTASIGFMPLGDAERNVDGGFDFVSWELLEWSLVPVPSNQEALRLAYKACTGDLSEKPEESDEDIEQTQEKATQSDITDTSGLIIPDFEDYDSYPDWVAAFVDGPTIFMNTEVDQDLDNSEEKEITEEEPNNDTTTNDASDDEVIEFFEQLKQALEE